jgi:hypothetical protein
VPLVILPRNLVFELIAVISPLISRSPG